MKKHIWIPILILVVLAVAAVVLAVIFHTGGPYKGTVTEKTSGNPVAGVSVTDGKHVVKTDENGAFTLKGFRKTHFITVTAPAGYTAKAYYIPTDKQTESYDFTLEKSAVPAGAAHSFLQISDTEVGENGTGDWQAHIKSVAESQNAAFLVHTGDICYEAGLKSHIRDMNTDTMGLPVYYCIGNHDYVDGKFGEELFESLYGPTWYSFEVGNVHYIVTPFGSGADRSSAYSQKDLLRWLKNDLENTDENMKVVVFNHTLCRSADYTFKVDGKTLDLKAYNLIAWAFGHYHYNYVEEINGVLNISTARPDSGGIDSSVSGTRQVLIAADGTVSTKMHYYDFVETEARAVAPQNTVWTTYLGDNILFCDTVFENGKVYTATATNDFPHTSGVYCLSAQDGSVQWQFKTKNDVKNNVVLAGDNLYAQDAAGNVYCLSKENGKLVWSAKVNLGNAFCTSSALCVANGTVFAGGSTGVIALRADTGEALWENTRNKGETSPTEFIVTGNKLIVSSNWDALVALDAATGKQLWENKDSDIRFRSSTPIAVDDNTLLVADSGAIMLVDSNTGEIISKTSPEGYNFSSSAQPAVSGNVAYIATATKGVLAFDLTTHEILWNTPVESGMVGTAPYVGKSQTVESTLVLDGDTLVFGASDGNLYRISTADGSVLQTAAVGAPIFGKAANADGDWIVGDFAGRVSRVKL